MADHSIGGDVGESEGEIIWVDDGLEGVASVDNNVTIDKSDCFSETCNDRILNMCGCVLVGACDVIIVVVVKLDDVIAVKFDDIIVEFDDGTVRFDGVISVKFADIIVESNDAIAIEVCGVGFHPPETVK